MKRVLAMAVILAVGGAARAASTYSTGFEDFTLGAMSSGGTTQNGWSGGAQPDFTNNDAGDEQIVNTEVHSGLQSWNYRQGYGSPGQGTPFTPIVENGDGNGVSADGDQLVASLWFKAGSATPDGQTIKITTGTADGTDRGEYLAYIENVAGGLHLYSFTNGAAFDQVDLFSGVSTTDWHKLDFTLTKTGFVDAVTVALDGGTPVAYNAALNEWRQSISSTYADSSRLKIYAGLDGGSYQGLFIDDLSVSVTAAPEPASLALMGIGGMLLLTRRRKA